MGITPLKIALFDDAWLVEMALFEEYRTGR
jgi:hypothetical protein